MTENSFKMMKADGLEAAKTNRYTAIKPLGTENKDGARVTK